MWWLCNSVLVSTTHRGVNWKRGNFAICKLYLNNIDQRKKKTRLREIFKKTSKLHQTELVCANFLYSSGHWIQTSWTVDWQGRANLVGKGSQARAQGLGTKIYHHSEIEESSFHSHFIPLTLRSDTCKKKNLKKFRQTCSWRNAVWKGCYEVNLLRQTLCTWSVLSWEGSQCRQLSNKRVHAALNFTE